MIPFITGLIIGLLFAWSVWNHHKMIMRIKDHHIKSLRDDRDFWCDIAKLDEKLKP